VNTSDFLVLIPSEKAKQLRRDKNITVFE